MPHRNLVNMQSLPVDCVVALVRDPEKYDEIFAKWRNEEAKIRAEREELEAEKKEFAAEMAAARKALEADRQELNRKADEWRAGLLRELEEVGAA